MKHLLDSGITAQNVVAMVRNEEKAAELIKLGLEIRMGNYDHSDTLRAAFQDIDKLLFISSSSPDGSHRIIQHASVAKAARDAGVGHVVYTSLGFADKVALGIENVHLATEFAVKETHIPYTILRNAFYIDTLLDPFIPDAVASGVIVSAAKGSKMNFAARNDFALAAAKVLTTDGHQNKVYELSNPNPYSFDEFAAIISEVSHKEVKHIELTPEQAKEHMLKQGVSEGWAGFYTQMWKAFELGYFSLASNDLINLIGNKLTSVKEEVQKVLNG
ncbi:SDR family oxidoreductase [Dehalobacter sp. DCM]|nr:SDR family oxidoreductase [Dehalobacter sp. DCM]